LRPWFLLFFPTQQNELGGGWKYVDNAFEKKWSSNNLIARTDQASERESKKLTNAKIELRNRRQ
jgi:hypothetical protein